MNYDDELIKCYKEIDNTHTKMMELLRGFAKELNITQAKVFDKWIDADEGYRERYVSHFEINGINLMDHRFCSGDVDEYWDMAFRELKNVKPANSIQFIKEGEPYYDLIKYEDDDVDDIRLGKIALYCLKNNVPPKKMKDFLDHLLCLPDDAIAYDFTSEP